MHLLLLIVLHTVEYVDIRDPERNVEVDQVRCNIIAKHNLRSYLDDAAYGLEARSAELLLPMAQGRAILKFNDLNWRYDSQSSVLLREDVAWSFGIDISVGKPIESYTDGITSEQVSFQLARPTFSFEKGQRVGIAVYMKRKPTLLTARHSAEHPLPNVSDDDLLSVFGSPGNVNIYTGKITLMGDHHIEYDINSFTGCAGAIVFLLDENQPESVHEGDYGKAIAVHGGAHPTLTNRNLGFKLKEEHLSSSREQLCSGQCWHHAELGILPAMRDALLLTTYYCTHLSECMPPTSSLTTSKKQG
jgi:hypothetical protein